MAHRHSLKLDSAQDKLRGMIFHKVEGDKHLLWGLLHVKIIGCKKLRNLDGMNVRSLLSKRKKDLSDPYVTAFLGDYRLLKTKHIDDDLNPVFDEEFYCPVAHIATGVTFKVVDRDVYTKDDTIGEYFLPADELIARMDENEAAAAAQPQAGCPHGGSARPGDLKRVGIRKTVFLDGKKKHGSLEFFIEFIPTKMLKCTMEVPGVYFKQTIGNDVKLYVNADDDGSAPIVRYGGPNNDEKVWQPPRLWRDIFDAVSEAKQFVYVAGWSVDTDQYLLRGKELEDTLKNGKYNPKIGELFKAKADEGVIVNLMQWDDQSSNFLMPGMMGTYDEKTRIFFNNTKVNCELCPMTGGDVNSISESVSKKMAFTHHQKYLIMDAPNTSGGRELRAFIGGVDLTEGRWDNRQHPLFRSMQCEHKGDFYTKCFNLGLENGPRQPWHDIHSAVRGPEAINLAQAFEERWTKQCNASKLVNRNALGFDNEKVLENKGGWCTQLSRSIDSRVNTFDLTSHMKHRGHLSRYAVDEKLWKTVKEVKTASSSQRFETATETGLHYNSFLDQKKGRLVDNSIHLANVHHIRRAEHFIYIESQYFMGSSFMWTHDSEAKCGNLLAAELTYKICEKIAAREPFAVYILLPMWMEGIPAANATQGLLYYQRRTIEAMYKKVQSAITTRMANSADHGLKVTDYLNFYCIGNRETMEGSQATGTPKTADEILLAKTRRHQIYVHSKMMIVDDNVALIGTANINQRSMDGCRDSEIMMTSWQPDHLATRETMPKGDIHAFRLHSWATIMGQMDDIFRKPSSVECVNAVNKIADKNWKQFMATETTDMNSHLLPFPLEFEGGEIKPRQGLDGGHFPDTKASVMGKKSAILPELMLT